MNFENVNRLAYGSLLLSLLCLGFFLWPSGEPDVGDIAESEIVFRGYPPDLKVSARASLSGGNAGEVPLGEVYQNLPKANLRSLGENFTLVFSREGFHPIEREFSGKGSLVLLAMTQYPEDAPLVLNPESGLATARYKLMSRWPWLVGTALSFLAFVALFFKQQAVARISQKLYKVVAKASRDKYIGTTVGDYRIISHLGQGAWGSVYEAIPNSKMDQKNFKNYRVAIKFYALVGFLDNQDNRDRFLKEGFALKDLDHPNIVHFIEAGETEDSEGEGVRHPYLVLEYISGEALDTKVLSVTKDSVKDGAIELKFETRSYFKISTREILEWMGPIVDALEYAHSKGLVHRDVKPANIKITDDGRPILLDFGLTKLSESTYTKTNVTLGTPAYAAPELIIDAKHATPASDQFSLGVMIYHMLSGQHPFGDKEGEIWGAIVGQVPPKPIDDFDEAVFAYLCKILAFEPEDRFSTVREAFEELEKVLQPWI